MIMITFIIIIIITTLVFVQTETLDDLFEDNVRIKDMIHSAFKYKPPPMTTKEIDDAMDEYLMSNLQSYKPIHPLLCVTFIETHSGFFDRIANKVISMNGTCDWAILAYRGSIDVAEKFDTDFKAMDLKGNKVVLFYYGMNRLDLLDKFAVLSDDFFAEAKSHPHYESTWDRRAMISSMLSKHPFNRRFMTKPLLMANLIPIARQYEYIWVFDGDIHVEGYDIARLRKNLHCAFDHPPMIAQPLIYENTQLYWYFNYISWENRTNVIAHETGFVEVQTPIFNGLFLDFYFSKMISRVLWSVNALGLDPGFDNTFCTMATAFAKRRELALYKLQHNIDIIDDATQQVILSKNLTPCAVIVDGTPVHHHDLKVIAKLQDWRVRQYLFFRSIEIFNLSFPEHFTEGHKDPEKQPYGNDSKLMESKSLIKECKVSFK